jgi:hypothetical protein
MTAKLAPSLEQCRPCKKMPDRNANPETGCGDSCRGQEGRPDVPARNLSVWAYQTAN